MHSQLPGDFDRLRIAQIEYDTAFALIPLAEATRPIESGTPSALGRNSPVQTWLFGALDPNHFSAEMSQLKSGIRPCPDP